MLVEHPVSNGATDEQWRALIRNTGVRMKNDSKPWGPLARRDFLNWLERDYPARMPQFFESKEEAEIEVALRRKKISNTQEESKKDRESEVSTPESEES